MPNVVTAGELLVEIMRPEADMPLDERGPFVGPYPSGAPAIFVDTVQRLGVEAGIVGTVGDDAFGRVVRERLATDGVDVGQIEVSPDHTTGTAFVSYTADGDRDFLFHVGEAAAGQLTPDRIDDALLADCAAVHVSGSAVAMNAAGAACCRRLVETASANGMIVSFDPNVRPSLVDEGTTGHFEWLLDRSDIVTPTPAELAALVPEQASTRARVRSLLESGCELVALTRGADGCIVTTATETVDAAGFSVDAVDPTGAGDAFAAGLLVATLEGMPLDERATFANAAGACATTALGPMEGVPMRADVDAMCDDG